MLNYWLWLLLVMGPYNPRTIQVIAHFGDIETAFSHLSNGKVELLNDFEKKRATSVTLEKADELLNLCLEKDIKIVPIDSEDYPQLLKNIYNPPCVLFVCGDITVINREICLTVIGSRKHSSYSSKIGRKVCTNLSQLGIVLVSGLALGLDTVAHTSAIEMKSPTVAVLACGILNPYPEANFSLRKKIVDGGGVLISELLPNSGVSASYFRARNRILSGLSLGTIILQASLKSGCNLTAEHALQQGRDLFCIPPSDLLDSSYSGVIKYLREGAIPVFSHLDIVYEYYEAFSHKINGEDFNNEFREKPSGALPKESAPKPVEEKTPIPWDSLTEEQAAVVKSLSQGELGVDTIALGSGVPHMEIFNVLADLEVMGLIKAIPGGQYQLS